MTGGISRFPCTLLPDARGGLRPRRGCSELAITRRAMLSSPSLTGWTLRFSSYRGSLPCSPVPQLTLAITSYDGTAIARGHAVCYPFMAGTYTPCNAPALIGAIERSGRAAPRHRLLHSSTAVRPDFSTTLVPRYGRNDTASAVYSGQDHCPYVRRRTAHFSCSTR